MSPLKYSIFLGAALLLSACADEMPRTDRYDDGSISFAVEPAAQSLFSRGGGDKPALSFLKSVKIAESEKPLWIHVESAENPASFQQIQTSRALPVSLDDLREFTVTALLPDGASKFIDNQAVTKKNENSWQTATTYYWPQEDALTFFCKPNDPALPQALTNLTLEGKTFKFDYEVPLSEDLLNDAEAQQDFILAIHTYSRADVTNGVANIKFKHPLAGICFVQDESLDDPNLRIAKIELNGLAGEGSCVFNGNDINTAASSWTLNDSFDNTYTQTVDPNGEGVAVPIYSSETVNAVAKPFIVLPHKKNQLSNFKVKITLADGAVHEADLSGIDGLEPGRMYVIRLSGLDAKYPPVKNLQGMAGNGTVSLKWDNPEATYDHIHQCGVTVKITQKDNSQRYQPVTLTATIHWEDTHEGALYPDSKSDLDLFAYVKKGIDKDGNEVEINTGLYDEFECAVYADYYNTNDDDFSTNPKIHQSIARTITIKPEVATENKVFFYIPEGAKTPGGLLDDDDAAAWDWFDKTFNRTDGLDKYITHATLANLIENNANLDGYVIWIPCGVQLRGGNDYEYVTALPDADVRLNRVNEILQQDPLPDYLTKMGTGYYNEYLNGPAELLKEGARIPGAFNNKTTGIIERINPEEYFTQNDINVIRQYYAKGGNLLLTTFSIELAVEFGVIPYNCYRTGDAIYEFRPFFHLFNEVKPSSIWFVRSEFEGHEDSDNHPLYQGMFKCGGNLFPESKDDIHEDGDENKNFIYVGSDKDRDIQMYPLLSMGADACENNNVVWDFTDGHQKNMSMDNMENLCNGRFLGTWGQRGDKNVGVIFEFYPGLVNEFGWEDRFWNDGLLQEEKDLGEDWIKSAYANHGRCIAIGLGAYEFNNGMKYDPSTGVKNYYQSNVHRMTLNALNYLMTKPNDEK
ncbi:MAG: fimbrillin family protein [Muribaculaceae bacterium]|nr:fimbrillin family protein [Muribaculaceae bacterium]